MKRGLAATWLLVVVALFAGCSDRATGTPTGAAAPAAPPPVPVGVATAEEKVVPVQVSAVGNVQAVITVGVKSQMAGQITRVHFAEGREVKQGELLFTIDPRPFEATLQQAQANLGRDIAGLKQSEAALGQRQAEITQAQANLERDQAQWEMAKTQEARYKDLADKDLVAREQYEQIRTTFAASSAVIQADRAALVNAQAAARAAEAQMENVRASIKADEALVEVAKLNLAYTQIRAPMDGRTGNLLVQAGNVVKANEDNPMVVIAQVHPIYVSFSVPEVHLANIKQYRAQGALKVEAIPADTKRPASGDVTFVNNAVDSTTGTIQLKATFPNTDSALWPGQFVDVMLNLTTEKAVTVPTQAVQAGQQGPFVFVVMQDNKVAARSVRPGRRLAREIIIEQGVAAGERVVTDGQLRLVPGARVDIKPQRAS